MHGKINIDVFINEVYRIIQLLILNFDYYVSIDYLFLVTTLSGN